MSSIIKKSAVGNQSGGRPPAAVELSAEGVLAAALPAAGSRRGTSATEKGCVYAFVPLPPGALVPNLGEADKPSLRAPEAVASAIRSALSQVAPRTRSVTLVLPDALVRVFVLDFDSMPAKASEAVSVVRFRLRKMVPFDVESAGVTCQILTQNEAEYKVLAAIVPGPILAEYEAAVRDAGYEPGAVLSSSLAALEAADATEGVLAVNLSARSITTVVTSGQELLLYRTLDLPADPELRVMEIERSIAVAAAYFEDKLGASPRRLYYAGIESFEQFAASIGNPEIAIAAWSERPEEGALTALPQTSFAGVTGALAGAS